MINDLDRSSHVSPVTAFVTMRYDIPRKMRVSFKSTVRMDTPLIGLQASQ